MRSAPAVAAPADPSVILSTRSLLNNNRATSATMASGRPASNPQDPSEEAASAGLNLSQLILSSQQTSHLSGTRSSSNSRSQIGNNLSQLPESVRRNAEAVTLSDSGRWPTIQYIMLLYSFTPDCHLSLQNPRTRDEGVEIYLWHLGAGW